jgi:NosR/NirI family transcriptional regulator, nitrous oxide reductase regulator
MKPLCTILCLTLLFGAGGVLAAGELIPVPSFSNYEVPETQHPAVRAAWYDYLDLAALATGLVLASYFALWSRSRRGLFLLAIASLAWLGFWRNGCVCPIGALQNVTLGLTDPSYTVPLVVVAFFALPLVFTLFFGRTFCAAVCPLGAIQELVAVRPIKVPKWLDHALGLLAYVYLGLAVLLAATGTAFLICRYDPFVAFFRRTGSVNMLIFGACFLLVGVFVGRPY